MNPENLKCVACWQEPKPINLINQRGQCYNCQEKYNRLLYLARCDACQKKIFPKKMDKKIIHDAFPLPVPEINSGLELAVFLKEFIKEKGGQQQINGWFLFCFECENELIETPKFNELKVPYGNESFSFLEKIEKAGTKLSI